MKSENITSFSNYIDGKWVYNPSSTKVKVVHKYNLSILDEVSLVDASLKEFIITSALNGFAAYKEFNVEKRIACLQKLLELITAQKDFFVDLLIKEAGKPRSYSVSEVERCLTTLQATIREAYTFSGEMVPMDFGHGSGKTAYTKPFARGVVFCITPFNFPLNLLMHKIAPALAVGCSVIIKPSPHTPLAAIHLMKLLDQCGYPAGVVNLIQTNNTLAEEIAQDERIAMISFTGSDSVGWHLKNICGKKKVALELGGNAAVIVEDAASLKNAAKVIATGAYLYAGQICISTQRILVNQNIYQEFLNRLLSAIESLPVGDPSDMQTLVGPMIDYKSFIRVVSWVDEAKAQGAQELTQRKSRPENNILYPILLARTTKEMKVVSREVFGPVAVIEVYDRFEDAIAMANDTVYGLQAGVFTDSLQKVQYAFTHLEVGGVIINNVPGFRVDHMPYGGIKNSGFGREGIRYAMEEMTEKRLLVY